MTISYFDKNSFIFLKISNLYYFITNYCLIIKALRKRNLQE
jgi:hypothetical protein